jgi:HEPN domain-containing protein
MRWLERARDDLRIVDVLLAQPAPSLYGTSLHCQQAAEKLSKAVLIAYSTKPPRIHDIGELAALVAAVNEDIGRELATLSQVTTWYVASRYPEVAIESQPSLDDIRSAIVVLRKVVEQIVALAPTAI